MAWQHVGGWVCVYVRSRLRLAHRQPYWGYHRRPCAVCGLCCRLKTWSCPRVLVPLLTSVLSRTCDRHPGSISASLCPSSFPPSPSHFVLCSGIWEVEQGRAERWGWGRERAGPCWTLTVHTHASPLKNNLIISEQLKIQSRPFCITGRFLLRSVSQAWVEPSHWLHGRRADESFQRLERMIKSWPQLRKQEEFESELEMSPAFSHGSLSATCVHNKSFRVCAVVNGNNMHRLYNRNFKMFKFFCFSWMSYRRASLY